MKIEKKEKQATKSKMGRRPFSLSDEQIKELEVLAEDLTIAQIADYFGICEKTFHELKNRDSTVSTVYKKGKVHGVIEAAGDLKALRKAGDTTATIFYLKARGGWSDKPQDNADDGDKKLQKITISVKKNENQPR